ncbi:MAG: PSD1 domain-containing protein [Bryobacterales bacterium]|nr:PSD1 domain-containing protein [Bryobacterales bacterium]
MPARAVILVLALVSAAPAEEGVALFTREVRPVLEKSCWNCHGGAVQLARLDLRTRESALRGGEKGPVLVPGDPASSRLYKLVAGHEKPRMPLEGALPDAAIDAIRRWIEQGAPWDTAPAAGPGAARAQLAALEDTPLPPGARDHWAFRPPVRPVVPVSERFGHPIDRLLEVRRASLAPAPHADRRTLLRRASLDLTGIPPSPPDIEQFLADRSSEAWQNAIDRLLGSPHYGERWGRHWLDVARYADSSGFEHDRHRPHAYRYRDYVVHSFNQDKPYNVFLAEQLAGDELDSVTPETLTATGFLLNHAKVAFREKDNPEFRFEYLDDMIATIGRGILGLSVQCARCHDHKFDPIPQKDYYKLQASLFGYVEVEHPLTSREEAEAYRAGVEAVEAKTAPLKAEVARIEQPYRNAVKAEKYKGYPGHVQRAIAKPEAERTEGEQLLAGQVIRTTGASRSEILKIASDGDRDRLAALDQEIARIERERPAPIPVAMGITDGDYRFAPLGPGDEPAPGKGVQQEATDGSFLHQGPGRYVPPPSYFLIRGDLHSRGSRMSPGFPQVLVRGEPPVELPPAHSKTSGRRRALAEWLTAPDHPLTARVMANRIWHHHFGRGIVPAPDNFGKSGEAPTHPELLDWLAVEFVRQGWSVKAMHRLIMTSEAYQMASGFATPAHLERDPGNRLLWRFPMQRLEAEAVRDSMLAVSGALNREIGGPAVFPPLPEDILASMRHGIWRNQPDGPVTWRRSVYVYRKRGLPFPLFEVFDLPDQNASCARRNVSTVPTQALTLLNNEFVLNQAVLFAGRVRETAGPDPGRQIELAYQLALARPPRDEERALALDFLRTRDLAAFAHVLFNLNEFLYLR